MNSPISLNIKRIFIFVFAIGLINSISSAQNQHPRFSSYEQFASWVNANYDREELKCDSSMIDKIAYFPKGRFMQIFFKSNPQKGYLYQNISLSKWNEFKNAPSKGRFYNARIRGNRSIKINL